VTLDNANVCSLTFTAPSVSSYNELKFSLIATDDKDAIPPGSSGNEDDKESKS
jgi:hypothetical protein